MRRGRTAVVAVGLAGAVALVVWLSMAGQPAGPSARPIVADPTVNAAPHSLGAWASGITVGALPFRITVLTEHGPAVGAQVAVHQGLQTSTGATDAAGDVHFNLIPGPAVVIAERDGQVAAAELTVTHDRPEAVLRLLASERILGVQFDDREHVVRNAVERTDDDQVPVPGAEVVISIAGVEAFRGITNEVGNVLLPAIARGDLSIHHPDYLDATVALTPEWPDLVTLDRPSTLSGTVQFEDGGLAAGATLHSSTATATSDRAGHFELTHHRYRDPVHARLGDTTGTWSPGDRTIDPENAAVVVLHPMVRVKGLVIDGDTHQPIAGALISRVDRPTLTDRRGQFEVLLEDEAGTFDVSAEGYASTWRGKPGPGEVLSIELFRPAEVTGRIIDDQERPVPGAEVFTDTPHPMHTVSDAEGRYALAPLCAQSLRIGARSGGASGSNRAVVEGGTRQEIDVMLEPEPVPVTIRVEAVPGKELDDSYTVTATRVGRPWTREWTFHSGLHIVRRTTLHRGRWKLVAASHRIAPHFSPTEVVVDVTGPDDPPIIISVHKLPPAPPQSFHLHVIDARGSPVEGAQAWVHFNRWSSSDGTTDANGDASLEIDGRAEPPFAFSASSGPKYVEGNTSALEATARLPDLAQLRVRIDGPLQPGDELALTRGTTVRMAIDTHEVVLPYQEARRTFVCVERNGEGIGCEVADPTADAETSISITLGTAGRLRYAVVDQTGQRLSNPQVTLDGYLFAPVVENDGALEVTVAHGNHVMVIDPYGHQPIEKSFEVRAGETIDLGTLVAPEN